MWYWIIDIKEYEVKRLMDFKITINKIDTFGNDLNEYQMERFIKFYKEEYIRYRECMDIFYNRNDLSKREEMEELRTKIFSYRAALLNLGYEIKEVEDEPKK